MSKVQIKSLDVLDWRNNKTTLNVVLVVDSEAPVKALNWLIEMVEGADDDQALS